MTGSSIWKLNIWKKAAVQSSSRPRVNSGGGSATRSAASIGLPTGSSEDPGCVVTGARVAPAALTIARRVVGLAGCARSPSPPALPREGGGSRTALEASGRPLPVIPATLPVIPAKAGIQARRPDCCLSGLVCPLPLTPALPREGGGSRTALEASGRPLPVIPATLPVIPAKAGIQARRHDCCLSGLVCPLPLTPALPREGGGSRTALDGVRGWRSAGCAIRRSPWRG